MFVALVVLHVLVAVSLVLIVLLQAGRGAELGAAFGGLGQATYGRGSYTFIHKVTTALAVIFMSTSFSLAFISLERPRTSLVSPTESGQAPAQPPRASGASAEPGTVPSLPQQDAPPAQPSGSSQ